MYTHIPHAAAAQTLPASFLSEPGRGLPATQAVGSRDQRAGSFQQHRYAPTQSSPRFRLI